MKEIINNHWNFFTLWMVVSFVGAFISFAFYSSNEFASKKTLIIGIVCIVFILFIWSVKLW